MDVVGVVGFVDLDFDRGMFSKTVQRGGRQKKDKVRPGKRDQLLEHVVCHLIDAKLVNDQQLGHTRVV